MTGPGAGGDARGLSDCLDFYMRAESRDLGGCRTATRVLHPGADGTWAGVLGSGLAMTWAR